FTNGELTCRRAVPARHGPEGPAIGAAMSVRASIVALLTPAKTTDPLVKPSPLATHRFEALLPPASVVSTFATRTLPVLFFAGSKRMVVGRVQSTWLAFFR